MLKRTAGKGATVQNDGLQIRIELEELDRVLSGSAAEEGFQRIRVVDGQNRTTWLQQVVSTMLKIELNLFQPKITRDK